MPTEIVMPRLSDTMDRGTIAHWNKQIGESVARGDVLVEIETDKATMELESYADGFLAAISVRDGETAAVGAPIGLVAKDRAELTDLQRGDNIRDVPGGTDSVADAAATETTGRAAPASMAGGATALVSSDSPPSDGSARIKASPLAKRVAEQRGLDLAAIPGTGPGGRITKSDVEEFAPDGPSTGTRGLDVEPASAATQSSATEDETVALTRMQMTVGRRLGESKAAAPHFYVTSEIDMTHAARMRAQINEAEPLLKVSFNDLIVKAAGVALKAFPQINASYRDGTVVRHAGVNVGIAVDLPGGLIVPVLKGVDRKTLRQITTETKQLVAAAREAKLKPDNFEGGTFTVSNLGMFGVDQFTAIINPPESAILAVGAIVEKPVVVNGEIVIRSRMRVTLSSDHRVIYGADAAAFLAELRRTLEHPVLALV